MITKLNACVKIFILVLAAVLTSFCYAAQSPDSFTFTATAIILGPQCTWVHEGETTASLGKLTLGIPVKKDIPVGAMRGVCQGTESRAFGFTVSLENPSKNGLNHQLIDSTTNTEIKDGTHLEKKPSEKTMLSIRTTGTPSQAGFYNNNLVMIIKYD